MCFDGKQRQELLCGDSVRVRMSPNPVPTIDHLEQTSDWFDSLFVWARLAALRLFGLCPRYTPRGSLARRDRSWRRILGCAVFVSFLVGVAMPSYASIPLVVWIAWRLHAPIVVAALVALGAGLVAGAFAGWTVAVSSVIPAVIVAVILAVILAVIFAALAPRTARFLGSS